MDKEKESFHLLYIPKRFYFSKNHTQNSIVWEVELKTMLNSYSPSTLEKSKAWKSEKYYHLAEGHLISPINTLIPASHKTSQ